MSNEDLRKNQREKFVRAYNDTMVKIWKEKITLLGAIDSGALLNSVAAVRMTADGRFTAIELEQEFLEYGFYVDSGTGKEVALDNGGDIGRDKVRKAKPWFFHKYISSVFKIRDFMTESLGMDIADTISTALSKTVARRFALNRK